MAMARLDPWATPVSKRAAKTDADTTPSSAAKLGRGGAGGGRLEPRVEVTAARVVGCESIGAGVQDKSFYLVMYPGNKSGEGRRAKASLLDRYPSRG